MAEKYLYQVQGNLENHQGERVFHVCTDEANAQRYARELSEKHPGISFYVYQVVDRNRCQVGITRFIVSKNQ